MPFEKMVVDDFDGFDLTEPEGALLCLNKTHL
jgi:hypothetical protein